MFFLHFLKREIVGKAFFLFLFGFSFVNGQVVDSISIIRCFSTHRSMGGGDSKDSSIIVSKFSKGILISDSSTSIVYYVLPNDTVNSYSRNLYYYDVNQNLLLKQNQNLVNGNWQSNSIDSNIYNRNGNKVYSSSINIHLGLNNRQYSVYNPSGQKISEVWQNLNNGILENSWKSTWDYGVNNQLNKKSQFKWKNNIWETWAEQFYYYDHFQNDTLQIYIDSYGSSTERRFFNALGKIDSVFKYKICPDGDPAEPDKFFYYYNDFGNIDSISNKNVREEWRYDPDQRIIFYTVYQWFTWLRSEYSYYPDGKLKTFKTTEYGSGGNKGYFEYDNLGNLIYSDQENWGHVSWTGSKCNYFYTPSKSALVQSFSPDNYMKLYPNPNQGNFEIELSENSEIFILNNLGQTVLRLELNKGINKIDMTAFPSGLYLVKTYGDKCHQNFKIIKN